MVIDIYNRIYSYTSFLVYEWLFKHRIVYIRIWLLMNINVYVRVLQPFRPTTLTTRAKELWCRDVLALMMDYLQDPDFTDDIDWKGCSDKQLGKFSTLTSGEWYREVQVILLLY